MNVNENVYKMRLYSFILAKMPIADCKLQKMIFILSIFVLFLVQIS